MRAILCNAWGEPQTLNYGDIPRRPLEPGQVRMRVHAAGVNFADTLMVAGKYQVKPAFPFSPGLESAGEITEVAPDVRTLRVGQRVLTITRFGGSYTQELVAQAVSTVPIPDAMDYVTAAAFPVIYGTAHFALGYRGNLAAGETLLVLGAAGGVGLAAVEVGKRMGARVIAAAGSTEKLAVAKQYGADELINYTNENIKERVRALTDNKGADVVFDPVGGKAFDQSLHAVNWQARLLIIGFASGDIPQIPANLVLVKNVSVIGVVWGAQAARYPEWVSKQLAELLTWWEAGKLKPMVAMTFPLSEAGAAMQALLSRAYPGKIVLTCA
jgi:NADPH2:quinone reductase